MGSSLTNTFRRFFLGRRSELPPVDALKEAILTGNCAQVREVAQRYGQELASLVIEGGRGPGVSPHESRDRSVLDFALYRGKFDAAEILARMAPPLVEDPDRFGRTLLMRMAYEPAVVDALIFFGAKVAARDNGGGTALHYAADFCSAESVVMVSRTGKIDPNARNQAGETPLTALIRGSYSERVHTLDDLLQNIRWCAQSHNEYSPTDIAAMKERLHSRVTACVHALKEAGMDLDAKDARGKAAFDEALTVRNTPVATALVHLGASTGETTAEEAGAAQHAEREMFDASFERIVQGTIARKEAAVQAHQDMIRAIPGEMEGGLKTEVRPARRAIFRKQRVPA